MQAQPQEVPGSPSATTGFESAYPDRSDRGRVDHHPIDLHAEDLVAPQTDLHLFPASEVVRVFVVVWTFVAAFVGVVLRKLFRAREALAGPEAGARAARIAFARLGPTYIKLGQMIASSPGMFPKVLADECQSLLDEVPPFPMSDVR